MSLLSRLLEENYDAPGESAAMRRGDSNSYLARMKARTPRANMSMVAGQWDYNPVEMLPVETEFANWYPPSRMTKMATPGRNINVRHEDVDDGLDGISDYLDGLVEAVFQEEG